jgi:hypothetical protein
LCFALERIGPLATIIITVFYLLILYLLALPNTPENLFASIYSESLIKTACQHLLLLVGFDTLIYRKYYDTPPILVGHHPFMCQFLKCHGLQLLDLPPNAILSLAWFVAFYEGYLGAYTNLGLSLSLFYLDGRIGESNDLASCGVVTITPHHSKYHEAVPRSVGWERSFFYCDDLLGEKGKCFLPLIPSFHQGALAGMHRGGLAPDVMPFRKRSIELVQVGLTLLDLLSF